MIPHQATEVSVAKQSSAIAEYLNKALEDIIIEYSAQATLTREAKLNWEHQSKALSEIGRVKDSIQAAINAYLNTTSHHGEKPPGDNPSSANYFPEDTGNMEGRKRGLLSEGRTRDTFQVLYYFPKPGLRRDQLRLWLGGIYTPKAVGTVLDRGLVAGYICREDKCYFLSETGKALVEHSQPYGGNLNIGMLKANFAIANIGSSEATNSSIKEKQQDNQVELMPSLLSDSQP